MSLVAEHIETKTTCYHCTAACTDKEIHIEEKYFCCNGCKSVYQLLNENDLCTYYNLNSHPGAQQNTVRSDKFSFLDNAEIAQKLLTFSDEKQVRVSFYLPHIHCSSCLWLLEHLSKIDSGILSSKVDFYKKEIEVVYSPATLTLRKVAELLTSVGYEPYISLQDTEDGSHKNTDRTRIYKIGVAGFCFGNIMMMSFPEYFAGEQAIADGLGTFFRYLNVGLSLPALFYSGSEFFVLAYKGLKSKFLNIDLPIALALVVTFGRSLYEVFTGTGSGYFDSMSGIIFFMLLGRLLQDKTYSAISFNRDYKSYFPVAVTRLIEGKEEIIALPEIQKGDILLIHNAELIPTDGILSKGNAEIDYSFITGESLPNQKEIGEIVYAGGKQMGANIELLVTHNVNQSYLTSLWNNGRLRGEKKDENSFIHTYSQYFTIVLLSLAVITGIYWYFHDVSKILPAVSAMLIVACPCALLLSATFTYGNILNIFAKNGFYVRSAEVVESLYQADMMVFDKTGTLTQGGDLKIEYRGKKLDSQLLAYIQNLAAQSQHPLSIALSRHLRNQNPNLLSLEVKNFQSHVGAGLEARIGGKSICLGSEAFIKGDRLIEEQKKASTYVHISIDNDYYGYFTFSNNYREGLKSLLTGLKKDYPLAVLSGDTDAEKNILTEMIGTESDIRFHQKPEDKWKFVQEQQEKGMNVMMLGDGLNDAGALQQSNVGIAVSENANYFSPACDAILHGDSFTKLKDFIKLAKAGKYIIHTSFALSILYNIVGLSIAVQANMSPMIAAILMPISSLSIVLITFGMSHWMGYLYLGKKHDNYHV